MKNFKIYSKYLIPLSVVSLFIGMYFVLTQYVNFHAELKKKETLETTLAITKEAVHSWYNLSLATAELWANSQFVKETTKELLALPVENLKSTRKQGELRDYLKDVLKAHSYKGYFIIDRNGQSLSSLRDENIGSTNLLFSQKEFINRVFKGGYALSRIVKSDVRLKGYYQYSFFSGAPILSDNGKVMAIFCFRIDPRRDFLNIFRKGRIGETGETYAISMEREFITESRFVNGNRPFKKLLPFNKMIFEGNLLKVRSDVKGYKNYRGEKVIGSWLWDKDLDMIFVSEMGFSEAYAIFQNSRRLIIILLSFVCILILVITYVMDRNGEWLKKVIKAKVKDLRKEVKKNERIDRELETQKFAIDKHAQVIICNTAGRITYANDSFCQTSKYSKDELIGHFLMDLNGKKELSKVWRDCLKTIRSGETWKGELANKIKSGATYWVNATIVPYKSLDGKVVQYIGVLTDITERKEAEIKLKRSMFEVQKLAKAKSEFLSSMSHEIRTPLNGILGMAEIMSQSDLSQKNTEYLELISYSARNLLGIINEILDYSKMEANKFVIERRNFELSTLIGSIRSSFSIQAESKGIDFKIETSDRVPERVKADDTGIFQILNNLVGNAIKFTELGLVSLEIDCLLEEEPKMLHFKISDTGIGMDSESLSRLFVPFEQADSSIGRKFGGTGLGVTIVKRIVDMLGGELDVHSRKGIGTVFTVRVPFEESSEVQGALDKPLVLEREDKTEFNFSVLVAEDNLINQKVIEAFLKNLGMKPEFAINGLEVLEALEYKKYDIIFMDMLMPEMGGIEATRIIREKELGGHPYIIALTANTFDEDRKACLDAGMNTFLSKPVTKMAIKLELENYKNLEKAA